MTEEKRQSKSLVLLLLLRKPGLHLELFLSCLPHVAERLQRHCFGGIAHLPSPSPDSCMVSAQAPTGDPYCICKLLSLQPHYRQVDLTRAHPQAFWGSLFLSKSKANSVVLALTSSLMSPRLYRMFLEPHPRSILCSSPTNTHTRTLTHSLTLTHSHCTFPPHFLSWEPFT
jgi:hypothetical protein